MDNGKFPNNGIRKKSSEDSSPSGSMFSRNLELKLTPASRDDRPAQQSISEINGVF